MLGILYAHVVALLAYGLVAGHGLGHAALHAAPVAVAAAIASRSRLPVRARSVAVSIGLLSASAVVVHLMHGAIEAHFHFFVVVTLLALYEDWVPYLLAFGYVLAHHGAFGALEPSSVYNHAGAVEHPWRWALVHAVYIAALGVVNVVHWRLNEEARAAAARSEERFGALVASLPVVVYRRALDHDGSVDFISDRIEELSGHRAAQLAGGERGYASLIEPDRRDAVAREIAAADCDRFTVEYPIVHADGGTRWVRDTGHVLRDADGSVVSVNGTVSDITDVKLLEDDRARIETELRLAQRLEAIGQLAAGIAHEINTPVQFVSDSVHFIQESVGDLQALISEYRALITGAVGEDIERPAMLEGMQHAEQSADLEYVQDRLPAAFHRTLDGLARVTAIVQAMREFGRPAQVEHAPADLNDALRSTLVVAQNEYKYVAEVETELGAVPPVLCNIGEINQVFLNLIVNAAHAIADASPPDGAAKGTITLRTRGERGAAVVTISDTGTGIPTEIRERIFEPFFTTKEVGRGTGQGLAIARSIVVDKHDGTLTVDSRPGHGSTFEIRLPLPATTAPAQPLAA